MTIGKHSDETLGSQVSDRGSVIPVDLKILEIQFV